MAFVFEEIRFPGLHAWLMPEMPEAKPLRAVLPTLADEAERFPLLPTHNRMNRVRRISFAGLEGTYILKEAWCNPVYPWGRRFCRQVRLWTSMPFLRAIRLAAELAAADFSTLRPVACWKERRPGKGLSHYMLYPEVAARGSLADFLSYRANGQPFFRGLPEKTLAAYARSLRAIHEAGFLHVDPAPGNVLLRPDAPDEPEERDFVWIDVESLRRTAPGKARTARERARRARSLERLTRVFDSDALEAFTRSYAGEDGADAWRAPIRRWAKWRNPASSANPEE